MIYGTERRATLACDASGCRTELEMAQVDSYESALDAVRRVAERYYGWRVAAESVWSGMPPVDVCPAHDFEAVP